MSDAQQLTAALQRKVACLVQLRDLGLRQMELIAAGEMSVLMKVLSAKHRLLEDVQAAERQLDPYRNQSPESRAWSNPAERERCQQLAKACEQLFAEIVGQERASESQLILVRDDAERRLQGMHVASQAHASYAADDEPAIRSFDLSTQG